MTPNSQASLEIVTVIEIKFSTKSERNAIMNALIPDNVNFPKGLSMKMSSKDCYTNDLILEFSCDIGIETMLNTIDEILDHIGLAEKVICDA